MSGRQPLLVVTEAHGSGLGRFSVDLANALEVVGCEVTLIAPPQPQSLRVTRTVLLAGPVDKSRIRKIIALAQSSIGVAGHILRRAGPGQPVLLIHLQPTLPISLAPIIAAKLARAKIIFSLHDFYPHTLRFPAKLQALERWLYRWAYRRFDLIATNNAEQTRRLIADAGVATDRVRTLFHGPFTVENLVPPDDHQAPLRLLVFGSLRPNKQIRESIRAINHLRQQGLAVELRIAGAPRREDILYWQDCLAEIHDSTGGFDVQARFVADVELAQVLSGVDAMLCPYMEFDSQSGVAVTAVSNAIPVIATDNVSVDGVDFDGLPWQRVAEPADSAAIARAIVSFAAIPRPERMQRAREIQAGFLAAAGWTRLAELYVQAMHERAIKG
jgi:glycosyltransferase involved in cell wall biosynthesis